MPQGWGQALGGRAAPLPTPLTPRQRARPGVPPPSGTRAPRAAATSPLLPVPSPRRRQRRACDRVPAITTGRAVTLQRASALSPATNQGQPAALLDRACLYVLLLLMPSPARLTGTQSRAGRPDGGSAPLSPPLGGGCFPPRMALGERRRGTARACFLPGSLRFYL